MTRVPPAASAALSRQFDQALEPASFPAGSRIRDAVTVWAPRSGTVVDIGCRGGQSLAALAARRPDLTLIGIEPERDIAARARKRLGDRAQIVSDPITRFSLEDASVDVAMSAYSLGRFAEGPAIAGEILRVLKPGGRGLCAELDAEASDTEWASFLRGTRLPRGVLPVVVSTTYPLLKLRGLPLHLLTRIAEDAGLDVLRASNLRGLATILLEVQRPADAVTVRPRVDA